MVKKKKNQLNCKEKIRVVIKSTAVCVTLTFKYSLQALVMPVPTSGQLFSNI